jgi:hypothetical protein
MSAVTRATLVRLVIVSVAVKIAHAAANNPKIVKTARTVTSATPAAADLDLLGWCIAIFHPVNSLNIPFIV